MRVGHDKFDSYLLFLFQSVRFLSDIGGAMGLFLGASVLSFVEAVQLILEIFLYIKHKGDKKNRVIDLKK